MRTPWLLLVLLLTGCASTARAPQPSPSPTSSGVAAAPPVGTPRVTATSLPRATATPAPQPGAAPPATANPDPPVWSYPIGWPGSAPGVGFMIRHGFQTENTWFNPGDWHTGEDWYALEGDTAGANVYAVADGAVVYVESNYPGRVVIVQHAADLFSVYGHLAFEPPVAVGQHVRRGEQVGVVLQRSDGVPNHLHFEIRTFLLAREVNGATPRYAYRCGRDCPPGPGYWPIAAPELPAALGWRNPTHVIARRAFEQNSPHAVVTVAVPGARAALWETLSAAGQPSGARGELELRAGTRYPLLEQRVGPEAPTTTGAAAYLLWYRIALPHGAPAWLQAALPSGLETGADGRPSAVQLLVVPDQAP